MGYRTRDEVALFALHAAETPEAFRTRDGAAVDGLDLALAMKLLPRIDGAGAAVRLAVLRLFVWAVEGTAEGGERAAVARLDAWQDAGRPAVLPEAVYPRTAARLARIVEGVVEDGVASYWA